MFIYLLAEWTFWLFPVWSIMHKAAINICICAWARELLLGQMMSMYLTSQETAKLSSKNSFIILYSYKQCMRASLNPHLHQDSVLLFLTLAIFMECSNISLWLEFAYP